METKFVFDTPPVILNDSWINKLRVTLGKISTQKKQMKRSNRYMESKILRNCKPLDVQMLIPLSWL